MNTVKPNKMLEKWKPRHLRTNNPSMTHHMQLHQQINILHPNSCGIKVLCMMKNYYWGQLAREFIAIKQNLIAVLITKVAHLAADLETIP